MSPDTKHATGRQFITPLEAIALLPDSDKIHTFRISPMMLIGADWSRTQILSALSKAGPEEIEIGGEQCRRMKHGLVLWTKGEPLFIEAVLPEGQGGGE